MAEKGPILRSGTVTNRTTTIGTFASSTGLPPESYTTSFINQNIGIFDGHDTPSGFVGLRTSGLSLTGGYAAVVAYNSISIMPSISGNALSFASANAPITGSNPGTTLPTPPAVTVYYKMVGYYTTGAVYESFVTTGSPAASSTTNPNTGHALINTFVAQSWTSGS